MKLRVKLALGSCKIYELDDAFPAEDDNGNDNETITAAETTTTSIRQLKTIIAGLTGIPVESQKLIYLGHILGPDEAPFRIHETMRGYSTVTILVAPTSSKQAALGYWGRIPRRGGWPACAPPPDSTNDDAAVVVSVHTLHETYVSLPMNPYRSTVKDLFDLCKCKNNEGRYVDLLYRGTRLCRHEYNLIDYGIGDGSGDDGGGGGETGPAVADGGGASGPAGEDSTSAASTTTATTTTTYKTYYVYLVQRLHELGTQSSDRATVRRSRRLTAHLAHLPVVLYPRALAKIGRERHALLYALHHLLPPDHMVAPAATAAAVDDGCAASDESNKLTTPEEEIVVVSENNNMGFHILPTQLT
jgi:hypothetical protein